MHGRRIEFEPKTSDLVMPFPANWTAIIFFGVLGLLHMSIALPSFWQGHHGGYVSLILGTLFIGATAAIWLTRSDLAVLCSERRLRLRTRLGRMGTERSVPFECIHGVRVLSAGGERSGDWRVEILCESEEIECPPTPVPRQQALCLAMAMGVRLIKISGEEPAERACSVPRRQSR